MQRARRTTDESHNPEPQVSLGQISRRSSPTEANFILTDDVVISGNITVLFLLSSSEQILLQRAQFSKFRILIFTGDISSYSLRRTMERCSAIQKRRLPSSSSSDLSHLRVLQTVGLAHIQSVSRWVCAQETSSLAILCRNWAFHPGISFCSLVTQSYWATKE